MENYIMLGITVGARKTREDPYAVDGRHQKCNWALSEWHKQQLVQHGKKWHS